MNQNRQSNTLRNPSAGPVEYCCGEQPRAKAAADTLKAISNRYRIVMCLVLMEHEYSVGELSERVGLSPSGCSQHLAILRQHGFVQKRRDRQHSFYSLVAKKALPLLMGLSCIASPLHINLRSRGAPTW